jgi:hypothetical protein
MVMRFCRLGKMKRLCGQGFQMRPLGGTRAFNGGGMSAVLQLWQEKLVLKKQYRKLKPRRSAREGLVFGFLVLSGSCNGPWAELVWVVCHLDCCNEQGYKPADCCYAREEGNE